MRASRTASSPGCPVVVDTSVTQPVPQRRARNGRLAGQPLHAASSCIRRALRSARRQRSKVTRQARDLAATVAASSCNRRRLSLPSPTTASAASTSSKPIAARARSLPAYATAASSRSAPMTSRAAYTIDGVAVHLQRSHGVERLAASRRDEHGGKAQPFAPPPPSSARRKLRTGHRRRAGADSSGGVCSDGSMAAV